ncbi:hypothetical protein [Brevibacterium sp. UCMA 11754]|uniref:hypothetical protein n=1 Tax=Brevibacterium sp. UCMA 11754 TaxID=2749198 RepID=UPI002E1B3EA3
MRRGPGKHREKGIKRAEKRQSKIDGKNAKRDAKGKTLLPAATADAPVTPMPAMARPRTGSTVCSSEACQLSWPHFDTHGARSSSPWRSSP